MNQHPTSNDTISTNPVPATVEVEEWMTSADGLFRARFTDIGEGLCGDYDETDPDDEPRLRVDVQVSQADHPAADEDASLYEDNSEGWWMCHDGSICTDINTDTVTGAQRARLLASLLTDLTGHHESIKRIMDTFSWATATSADPKAA